VKKISKQTLETIYHHYNRVEYVHPDPLEFLYNYQHVRDREIISLIASSLAYGTVTRILKSIVTVVEFLGPDAYTTLLESDLQTLKRTFRSFKHRFTTGNELAHFLYAIKLTLRDFGSLEQCLAENYREKDQTLHGALDSFVKSIKKVSPVSLATMLPNVDKGSACKRLNLCLRWMIRKDSVDRGGWGFPQSKLIIPLDTHMHYFSLHYGLTKRKSADITTAFEITTCFKRFNNEDPVKYDFAISRFGIRKELSWLDFEKVRLL